MTILDAFLDDWRPIPDKRMDFLRALASEPPADVTRLYWLARVTLVTRLEDIPRFDALFGVHFLGHPTRERPPSEEGEEQAPQPSKGGEQQPIGLREGTGKDASVHELRAPPRLRRHQRRPARAAQGAGRAPPADPLAPAAPRAPRATSTCAARCARPPARARSPRSPAATAPIARGRCWC